MTIARRTFLQAGAVATVTTIATGLPLRALARAGAGQPPAGQHPAAPPFEIPYASQLDPVFYLKKESFTSYLNTSFAVGGKGKQARLTLIAVEDLRANARRPDRDGFALVFTDERQKPLSSGTYQLTHDALGEFSLLLVRVGERAGRPARYEAIINRLYP